MQSLIDEGNVVYEDIEVPVVADAQPASDESASSSVKSPSQQRSQQEEEGKNQARDINSVLADLQVGQNSPNAQAAQSDGQQALTSFFNSLNQPAAQQ